ncbi:MAG: prepilin peptidase [Desulfobacterales bacterium]|nr:prepilin peptidase [Desulfobacterales bacterium]
MAVNSVLTIFAALLGLVIGSFLNVCIYRIPLMKSIIHPPSSCPSCGQRIKFYDNIPLISYLLLLGKCRRCGHPIPIHYPMVEAMMGLLSTALFVRLGPSPQYVMLLLFSASLVTISFIDLHHKIIPDLISLPGILIGLGFSFFPAALIPWSDSLIGIIGGGGVLYLVAITFEWVTGKEGMGGGDVKLMAMIGAWMGWRDLPFIILISSLSGILIGGISLLATRQGMRTRIPFGPFLALGALVYFFFGHELVSWFYGLGT